MSETKYDWNADDTIVLTAIYEALEITGQDDPLVAIQELKRRAASSSHRPENRHEL